MGICFIRDLYEYNKTPIDVQTIREKKEENDDFKRLCKLIEKGESPNKKNIPKIFKFLKIDKFYLGLQNMEEIYDKYTEEFKSRKLNKKDSVHASLLFSFSGDCNYFIDYLPSSSNPSFIYCYPNEKKGLRYKEMTFEEFIHYNSVCIIRLKAEKNITLYELFENIYSDNKWKYENYNLEKNNCCHFAKYIMEMLDSTLYTKNKMEDIIFTVFVENNEKEKYIDKLIPYIFLTIL